MLDRRHHVFAPGHICDEHRGLAAGRGDFGGHRVELGAVDIHQRQIGAVPRQTQGNGPAYALPGAGDQRDFTCDTHDNLLKR